MFCWSTMSRAGSAGLPDATRRFACGDRFHSVSIDGTWRHNFHHHGDAGAGILTGGLRTRGGKVVGSVFAWSTLRIVREAFSGVSGSFLDVLLEHHVPSWVSRSSRRYKTFCLG